MTPGNFASATPPFAGLGDDIQDARAAATWVHMPAYLKHSIQALTAVVMLLVLLN